MGIGWRVATATVVLVLISTASYADESISGDLVRIHGEKVASGDAVNHEIAQASGTTVEVQVTPQCAEDLSLRSESCVRLVRCSGAEDGVLHHVWRREGPQAPWQRVGSACLGEEEAESLGSITPGLVLREMRALDWPSSPLRVQPPGGTTLVQLDTNFYTDNTATSRQTVRLLGRRVEIEATPIRYVWHFARSGDGREGAASTVTTDPGAPYPDLRVTHRYRFAPATVSPSVDTVYAGRYRVEGGPWQEVPDTHTVPGDPVTLTVVEAHGHLVDATD